MGRVEKGFDFLGYHLSTKTLSITTITLEKVQSNIARLYEQGASIERIGQYWRKWLIWVKSGLGDHSRAFSFKCTTVNRFGLFNPMWFCYLK